MGADGGGGRGTGLMPHLWRRWRGLPSGTRGDYIMAMNRLLFGSLMLAASFLVGRALAIDRWAGPIALWLACSAGLLGILVRLPNAVTLRRGIGLVLDVGGTTILLLAGGEAMAFLYVVYHWIVIGNGYRFGGRYTIAGSIVSSLCFLLVINSDPFWLGHASLSGGLLSGLLVLPAYSFFLTRQLEQSRRAAEQANQAKSLFLASVSHELRTPLNAIVGTVELLRLTALDDNQRGMVDVIDTAADGQLALVKDVLSFASLEAGQGQLHPADFDLGQMLNSVGGMIEPTARLKGLRFGTALPPVPLWLHGDDRRVREVLLNICSNAVKFTAAGSVTLSASVLDEEAASARIRFTVADTGIGIRPEAQARIFDLFTQADDTILNRFGGTGLGLALCKRQVEMMGGAIGVHSTPGAGSTFWVEVPFNRAAAPEAAVPAPVPAPEAAAAPAETPDQRRRAIRLASANVRPTPQPPPAPPDGAERLAGRTVLVADDNAINRSILERMLTRAGVRVVFAADGEQALDVLLDGKVDAALLDVNMPVMNGIEAAKMYAFSTLGGPSVPLVALTADATAATADACRAAGMAACLVKPIRSADLLATLGTALPEAAPAARPASTPVAAPVADRIDTDILSRLLDLGDAEFVSSLVACYAADGAAVVAEVGRACVDGELMPFRLAAHSLASMSANMGAVGVGRLCARWQGMGEPEFLALRGSMPDDLRAAWDDTLAALTRWSQAQHDTPGRLAAP